MKMQMIGPGYRLGMLTVEEATPERKGRYVVWRCKCDCGGEVLLDTRKLQRGTQKDCGCRTKIAPGIKDLTGKRFGKLVALEPTEERKRTSVVWRCRCDCGREALVPASQLHNGFVKSCGCLSHPPIKDYVGRRFGKLTVEAYAEKKDGHHMWKCICDCGNES